MKTHTKKWKRQFIRSLFRSMQRSAIAAVEKMPAEWDGHEIREYLADEWQRERMYRSHDQKKERRAIANRVLSDRYNRNF